MRRRGVSAGGLDTLGDPPAGAAGPVPGAPGAGPGPVPPVVTPPPPVRLQTEFTFHLPRGYVDEDGTVHREGTMRLATARDELAPLVDLRVKQNPAYLSIVLLSLVVTRLGTVTQVRAEVIERLFASDLAFLQDLYRRINAEGHTLAEVTCPDCESVFEVDLAGGRPGES